MLAHRSTLRTRLVCSPRSWKDVDRLIEVTRTHLQRSSISTSTRAASSSSSDSNSTSGSSSGSDSNSSAQQQTTSSSMVSVDITKANFQEVLPAVRAALASCAFFAVDCEMTGLHTDGAKHEYMDDHQNRYSKMAESSKQYIITQYGISCFKQTGPDSYEASTFNFFVFPQPHGSYCRRFLCDASSLAFLAEHNFNFNTCITQGVPYMPLRTRDWQLMQVDRVFEPRGDPAVATHPADIEFLQDLKQLVTDWLAGRSIQDSLLHMHGGLSTDEDAGRLSADEDMTPAEAAAAAGAAGSKVQHDRLVLLPLNSFRRLLAFQELRKPQFGVEGHPGFYTTKVEGDSSRIVLVRATQQQAEAHAAQERADKIARIHAAAGFAAVFDAMRASGKPCVGHNCMFDISYGLFSFADSYLPATWNDYKTMVRAWHRGGIWDTKYLARRLDEVFEDTSLSSVYSCTNQPSQQQLDRMQPLLDAAAAALGRPVQLPTITHAPGYDKYRHLAPGEAAHEAGYDAFMTGASMAALLPLVAGTVASDPTHELSLAHKDALSRAAAAAGAAAEAAAQATPAQPAAPTPAAQQQQQPNGVSIPQQPKQQDAQEPVEQQQQQQQQQQAPSLWSTVSGVVGRLNLTFSDLPYASLWGEDPVPERTGTFHLAGLQDGYRMDDVGRLCKRLGLGWPRVTPVDSSSCLVTFKPEEAAAVPAALAEAGLGLRLTPWADWAAVRYSRRLPEGAEGGEAAAGMEAGGGAGGGKGYVSARAGRAAKRPRTAMEADAGGSEQPQQRSCAIM